MSILTRNVTDTPATEDEFEGELEEHRSSSDGIPKEISWKPEYKWISIIRQLEQTSDIRQTPRVEMQTFEQSSGGKYTGQNIKGTAGERMHRATV